ncbi:methyl-accepting chemotaxis protein [Paraburkholderia tropica]|uniref:Methyl-accepting chemotaxis sensory transducer with Pas/Pac sensor n=1 Tax=Paraburkholderia tropica TaxID=92647 RepID=A0AAQ1GBL1_9BURK|nr:MULTISPECIES: methyl-accepting chemotaxis protein [Paraburkholderia]MBB2998588.1 methyl-accepting chemotaxis protein [Paraburkholderia tropica]MBB6318637.1 methyl-accepting chemotaxis protein [Paraburkholderia tropica]MDE1139611.1 methyl-accepting chemotaxis protein [Paraburkholderia tropica]PXX19999.1 methyl-accepting chemotaxis sensory transducer with Pas/Pac sensor [Paraburkholderia tropica]PZW88940.1 methyl-accepting chemotaxis sensory transducer with Pas/Pac sensor [Paraburkholderia tr
MEHSTPERQLELIELSAVTAALNRVQAVIEFDLQGIILHANENFLATVGYTLDEVRGKHHRMFCEPEYARSEPYRLFWERLGRGEFDRGEYRRLGRDGREIWINASYNPVFGEDGRPYKVIKFATDITAIKQQHAEYEGRLRAIDKAQAVIEFDTQGIVLQANQNFLDTLGYRLEEIQGKHHRMFCDELYACSAEYTEFWAKLNRGEFDAGRYKRIGKGGRVVWIQATYNPIFDVNGRLYKVIKFANDVSAQVELEESVKHRAESDQRKVETLLEVVRNAAAGDLTGKVEVAGDDPIDQLAAGIKSMMSDLSGVIGKVVESAGTFKDSSQDIAARADTVAGGAQLLGATVEEMNASIEELTASINSIADNSRGADQLAKDTQQEAERGAKAVGRSIESMELINRSSEDIGEIIKVIGEIASQTNLLAFNAAIEAARAGEHGLGFSVVADEVRKLAERSSQATKEISKLINESVKRVAQGSEISKQAGEAFERILSGVSRTTQAISEISCGADEQLIAAREVAAAIQQVAEETEKSAGACDTIARAAASLRGGAEGLDTTVARFVV